MPENIFTRGDILIPQVKKPECWSVIACDQFTSEPEYWRETENIVGEEPSALRLIQPEARLRSGEEKPDIAGAMRRYLDMGLFRCVEDSFVYTERRLSGGELRRGLVGLLDLESYDYARNGEKPVRATEGTVAERLPPRVALRESAPLEIPHTVVFIDDPEDTVISAAMRGRGEKLYDFTLMQAGGSIAGWRVAFDGAGETEKALAALSGEARLRSLYGKTERPPVLFAVGDGNHSLAAAKLCWERLKPRLPEPVRAGHPARYSLVELENIHEPSIRFEPIHRVLSGTKTEGFVSAARDFFGEAGEGEPRELTLLAEGRVIRLSVKCRDIGGLIGLAESFCIRWRGENGGELDYVHEDASAWELCKRPGCCGILLPAMSKSELFPSIIRSGAFPRKSFSMGRARDKRYYLECRKIQ